MTTLTGCWDMTELNTIGIVYAVGFEKDNHSNNIKCTVQVLRPGTFKKDSASKEAPIEIATSKGKTVAEAVENMSNEFDRKIIFSQNKVIIIDSKLARKGILPILDYFKRDYAIRNRQWIVIAKKGRIQDLLSTKHGISNVQGASLEDIITMGKFSSSATSINLVDFYKTVSEDGINPVASVARTVKQPSLPFGETTKYQSKGIQISGTAVFKSDKLVGYLDDNETRGFNWITGEFAGGIVTIPAVNDNKKHISIRITYIKSTVVPKIVKGNPLFNIKILEKGYIQQIEDDSDTSTDDTIKKLQNEEKKIINKEIKVALDKIQHDLKSDIVGFGRSLSKKYPNEWDKIKKDWDKKFPQAKYTVTAGVIIKGQGLMFKPIKKVSK